MTRTIVSALVLMALVFASPSSSASRLAHNGPLLAFSTASHTSEIYVVNTDGSGLQRLTNDRRESRWPTLSPDGSRVAFARRIGDGLWKIEVTALDGSGLVELPSDGFAGFPAWSPDGTRIAYSTGPGRIVPVHLAVYDLASATATPLTSGTTQDTRPAWSPDGTRISFTRVGPGYLDLYTINADGAGLARVTVAAASYAMSSWSPDGTRIVFSARYSGESSDLYTVSPDGSGLTNITSTPDVGEYSPSWSATGIVFSRNEYGASQLALTQPDGKDAHALFPTPTDAWQGEPRFALDGQRIVFATNASLHMDIAVAAPDGSSYKQLTTSPEYDREPEWSPDGKTIAFSRTVGRDSNIYTVGADGTHLLNLTVGHGYSWRPTWSPDGTRIAFTRLGGSGAQIWVMSRNGTHVRLVTKKGTWNVDPTWSPDGRRIAYLAQRREAQGTSFDLYVLTLGQKKDRRVTRGLDPSYPAWSPDGARISFSSSAKAESVPGYAPILATELYTVRPDGRDLTRVTHWSEEANGTEIGRATWMPDGSALLYQASDRTFESDDVATFSVRPDGSGKARVFGTQYEAWSTSWQPAP